MNNFDSAAVGTRPVLLPAARLARALEGPHRWGYVDTTPTQPTVWVHKRLTIFPPGTTGAERRALKINRDLPAVGAVVTLFVMLGLGEVLPPLGAAVVACLLYASGIAISARLTHRLRTRCHRVDVATAVGENGYSTVGDLALLEGAAAQLTRLEDALDRGDIAPVDFEAEWANVYESVGASPHQRA